MIGQSSKPMVMTKVAEMVTVTRNSGGVGGPNANPCPRALTDKCGGHERTPTTPSKSASRKPPNSPKQRCSSRLFRLTGVL